jgi:hypothetical protein
MQAVDIELEPSVMVSLFESLDQVVEIANDGLISNDVMAHSFKLIETQVRTACFVKKRSRIFTQHLSEARPRVSVHDVVLDRPCGLLPCASKHMASRTARQVLAVVKLAW